MSNCKNCGKQVYPGEKFCTGCGSPVDAAQQQYPPQPQQQMDYYGAPGPANYVQTQKKPTGKKTTIIICAAIAALLVIGIVIFFVMYSGGDNALIGTWEDPVFGSQLVVTFNRNGTGELLAYGYRDNFIWGTESNGKVWMEIDGYRQVLDYEFIGGDLYIEGDRLVKVR